MKKPFFYLLFAAVLMSLNTFSQGSCCDYSLTGQDPGPIEAGETFGIGLGDIDNDGDLDAVVINAYDDMEVLTMEQVYLPFCKAMALMP